MSGVGVIRVCFPGVVLFLEIEVEGGVVVVGGARVVVVGGAGVIVVVVGGAGFVVTVVGGVEVPWCRV